MLNIGNIISKFIKNSSERELDSLKSTIKKLCDASDGIVKKMKDNKSEIDAKVGEMQAEMGLDEAEVSTKAGTAGTKSEPSGEESLPQGWQ